MLCKRTLFKGGVFVY